jgi:chromosome segregation ATPase
VQYLAEVQKKSGVFGGGKAELKLLACQRGEQNWVQAPGEEVIQADEASHLNAGALVLVELNANKQVQRIQEAGRPLVSILQNFSRFQERFKTQEEEIEQWKQSLTYQSQELNRREMEMEARREELEQIQNEAEQLESQRGEIESAREEAERMREEVERNRQELDGAWEHLRNEMSNLEQRQNELQQASVLGEEQARNIQEWLDRLDESIASTDTASEQLHLSFEKLAAQQSLLDEYWQKLETERANAEQLQGEVDRQGNDIEQGWQQWYESQASLEQARSELKVQQTTLKIEQDYAQSLSSQLQAGQELYQSIFQLVEQSADRVNISEKVDVKRLENMPLEELQRVVRELQQDLDKVFQFVNDQEEELKLQEETIEEVQAKLDNASGSEQENLQTELADEQDRYQMLNETLVGQRRTLREREEILSQHQNVMWQRLGSASGGNNQDNKVDLGPTLKQLEANRDDREEELQKLENEVEQMQQNIQQAQDMVDRQASQQQTRRNELEQQELGWLEQRSQVAQLWGRVNLYEEMLQPLQDRLNEIREQLEAIQGGLEEIQSSGQSQNETIAQLRQTIDQLSDRQSQQVAAS